MMGNGSVGIWAVIKVIIMDHHVVITSYFLAYLSLSLLSSANSDFNWFMAFQKQWNETNRDSTATNSKHVLHTHYSILVDGSFRRMCFVKAKKQTERHVCKHIFLSFGFFFIQSVRKFFQLSEHTQRYTHKSIRDIQNGLKLDGYLWCTVPPVMYVCMCICMSQINE